MPTLDQMEENHLYFRILYVATQAPARPDRLRPSPPQATTFA